MQAIGVWVQVRYRQMVSSEEDRVWCDVGFCQQLRGRLCIKGALAIDLQSWVTYRIIRIRVRGLQGGWRLVFGAQLPDLVLSQYLTYVGLVVNSIEGPEGL